MRRSHLQCPRPRPRFAHGPLSALGSRQLAWSDGLIQIAYSEKSRKRFVNLNNGTKLQGIALQALALTSSETLNCTSGQKATKRQKKSSIRCRDFKLLDKGLTNFRVLRMCGNMLSEATKLRALCFLKLFLLVVIVSSEN